MRTFIVVHPNPCIGIIPYLSKVFKHITVQYILSESPVKSFNQTVLRGLAGLNVFPFNTEVCTPFTHCSGDKLRTIV